MTAAAECSRNTARFPITIDRDPCPAGTYFVLDIYCQQGVENMLKENTTPAGDAG
jgi:hypothetical protein